MRHRLALIALAAAAPLAARDTGMAGAIPPSAAWKVEQANSGCTLSRDYGTGATAMTLGFRPDWQGRLRTVLLAAPKAPGALQRRATALVSVGRASAPVGATAQSGDLDGGRRLIAIFVDDALPDPRRAATITLQVGRDDPVTLAMPGAPAAFAALDTCQDAMMEDWGVFPYERPQRAPTAPDPRTVAVAPVAIGGEASWVTHRDYPHAAMLNGDESDSVIMWTIGVDGRVHDCRTIASSGSPTLDRTACAALTRRARYAPAKDALGRPVATHASRHVLWELPG